MTSRVVVFNNMITPYTNRLYNELVRRGIDLAVLSCTAQEPDRHWAGSAAPLFVHKVLPGWTIPLSRSRFTHVNFGIGRALRDLDPSLVVVNGFFPSMLGAALWASTRGYRLAVTTDGWAETMPDTLYHRFVRPWMLKRCRAVISCSMKGRAFFQRAGVDPDRVAIVPLVPAWDAPTEVAALRDRSFDLLWCARINDDAKNASFFEDVVIALHARRPMLSVRVVGSGPAEHRMKARFVAAGVNAVHDGHVAWQEVGHIIGQCRLMLLPSLLEPWGLVCNEAMQCGTLCLVSPHVGAAGELVLNNDSGLVRELVVDEWVEAVVRLLDDPSTSQEMSGRAREVARRVTLGASADAFQAVVSGAMSERPLEQGALHA